MTTTSESADRSSEPDTSTGRRSRAWLFLRRGCVLLIGVYVVVILLVYVLQARLLYFPSSSIKRTPADVGLDFEEVVLTTVDGVRIAAWYIPARDAIAEVLFFHGNTGNISDCIDVTRRLNSLHYGVTLMDYRGYGTSEGRPGEQGTYFDAMAAWKYLTETRGISPDRIVVIGESLGGAVAIDLATRVRPAALVTKSTFSSLPQVAAIHYPILPANLILRHRYDSISKVSRITCPKLFFHTTNDEVVPPTNAMALFNAAAEPKQFIETPGEHNTGGFMHSDEYAEKLRTFIDSALRSTSAG